MLPPSNENDEKDSFSVTRKSTENIVVTVSYYYYILVVHGIAKHSQQQYEAPFNVIFIFIRICFIFAF